VPAGATNVALKKRVTASDSDPVPGSLELITDGDKDGTDGSYVGFGPGKQWVQIDLGNDHAIHAIAVWHYHAEARVYRGVVVQVSDDPDFIKNVQTIFNNDQNNSLGLGTGKQWVQVDLGKEYAIYAVVLWHYHSEGRVYHAVVGQVSDDPDFIKNVQTIFNNDQNNSLGLGAGKDYEYIETNEGRLIDAKGVKGRYVRFYSKGNTSNEMNHYTEIEVFGKAP
jgi:hypothetical protein